jgi:signal transduction histidine kinase
VHLDLPEGLWLHDPLRAQVLLRCTQEIITNCVRHAGADNLWVRVAQDENGITLSARDDGRGVDRVEAGNGLNGMEERLRQLGGELTIDTQSGAGFLLRAWMPREGGTLEAPRREA